ncbi:DUF599 domain-containing protein [Pseudosulfitobacter koreensis]|uniref:DUF599 domain-containing protein n=1 Tax=Pseudosulfitobacter koreensis TaxID=2968472 RepID=A0ABT1YW85_9RHOB|nr:DUF599 domain-containing protein [Pseudosulfitobacter koreense]MCR8825160.1 DUF599 domain-containing protein [Pseudosulfitobacter koreense]
MTWTYRLTLFDPLDYIALGVLVAAWLLIGWRVESTTSNTPSTARIMAGYRREWMVQMVTREPRIFDAQILSSLRQSTAFFASTAAIAIGGALAMIGNAESITEIANDLILTSEPVFVWEAKLLIISLFLTNAFLKFVWANRLFGYAAVVMASVPNDPQDPMALTRAGQSAEINIAAARSFNRGLRAVYFGIAMAAWLLGPAALLVATTFTLAIIWRREFASNSRRILLGALK